MRKEVLHVTITNFPIDRVYSGRENPDENFARLPASAAAHLRTVKLPVHRICEFELLSCLYFVLAGLFSAEYVCVFGDCSNGPIHNVQLLVVRLYQARLIAKARTPNAIPLGNARYRLWTALPIRQRVSQR